MSFPSSMRRRDSNPQPLECESPPITTRPGLLPKQRIFYITVHPWSSLLEGFEGSYLPYRQTNLEIVREEVSTFLVFHTHQQLTT